MGIGSITETLYNPNDFDFEATPSGYAIKYKRIPIGSNFHEIPQTIKKRMLDDLKANNAVAAKNEIVKLVNGKGNKHMLAEIAKIEERRRCQK